MPTHFPTRNIRGGGVGGTPERSQASPSEAQEIAPKRLNKVQERILPLKAHWYEAAAPERIPTARKRLAVPFSLYGISAL